MISSNDFRPGVTIEFRGGVWQVIEAMHVKPGKGAAFVQTKLKNLENGSVLAENFRAGEKVPFANIEKVVVHFSYMRGDQFIMMDSATYEEISISKELIGVQRDLLKDEQDNITLVRYKDDILSFELPKTVDLLVSDTVPDERGDTSSGGGKPATLETGAVVIVPFHIKIGDKIRVDTASRQYKMRV